MVPCPARNDDCVGVGEVFHDLEADGALPRYDLGVGVAVDECHAVLPGVSLGLVIGLLEALAVVDEVWTPGLDPPQLCGVGVLRDVDPDGLDVEEVRCVGDSEGVVPAGGSDEALAPLLGGEGGDGVEGAPDLEAPASLPALHF
jgi:hypothetical protein